MYVRSNNAFPAMVLRRAMSQAHLVVGGRGDIGPRPGIDNSGDCSSRGQQLGAREAVNSQ